MRDRDTATTVRDITGITTTALVSGRMTAGITEDVAGVDIG